METLTPFLEKLAAKLGTTTEFLWAALMRQASISAHTDMWILIIMVVACIFGARLVIRKTKKHRTIVGKTDDYHGYEDDVAEWEHEAAVVAWSALFCLVGFTVMYFMAGIPGIISGLFNPEYWALKEVLKHIR